jgi:hypothetical protein
VWFVFVALTRTQLLDVLFEVHVARHQRIVAVVIRLCLRQIEDRQITMSDQSISRFV